MYGPIDGTVGGPPLQPYTKDICTSSKQKGHCKED